MTVGNVTNGAEPNRLKPRDVAEKKKIDHAEPKARQEDSTTPKTDRVEISYIAKSLLRKIVAKNDIEKEKHPEIVDLEEKFLQKMWEELNKDFDVRQKRVAEVARKVKAAYYDQPDIILATAQQIVNELLGE